MLELIVIIWLLVGFVLALSLYARDLWDSNVFIFDLADLFGVLIMMTSGPLYLVALIVDGLVAKYLHKQPDDIILFKHTRRE